MQTCVLLRHAAEVQAPCSVRISGACAPSVQDTHASNGTTPAMLPTARSGLRVHSRVKSFPNTFEPSSKPSTEWHTAGGTVYPASTRVSARDDPPPARAAFRPVILLYQRACRFNTLRLNGASRATECAICMHSHSHAQTHPIIPWPACRLYMFAREVRPGGTDSTASHTAAQNAYAAVHTSCKAVG